MIFYVYAYCDPRFKIDDEHCDFKPFYIGKGKNNRCQNHLYCNDTNRHKQNTIKLLAKLGLSPEIKIIKDCLSESEAFALEKKLIAKFGRRDNKTGILTNLTDGGEGPSGVIRQEMSEHTRSKLSASLKAYHATPEAKIKRSQEQTGKNNGFYGKKHSEETKEKIRQANKNAWTPEKKKAFSEKISGTKSHNYGKHHSEETKEKIRQSNIGKHKPLSVEQKIKVAERMSLANKGKPKSEETRAKIAAAKKLWWAQKKEHAENKILADIHIEDCTQA